MWPSLSRAKREEMSKTTKEVHRCSEERHVDGLCVVLHFTYTN